MSVEDESDDEKFDDDEKKKKSENIGSMAENMIFRMKNLNDKTSDLKKKNADLIKDNVQGYRNQANFIFFTMCFDEKELYQMFQEFYLQFCPDYEIGKAEFVTLIEMMALPKNLGKKTMEE